MIDYDDWGAKPVPEVDAESRPFWRIRVEELPVQKCEECGERQLYPREVCRHCWSRDLAFGTLDGTGTVHSYTRTHYAGAPGYGDEVPYTVSVIDLNLPEPNPSDRPVRLVSHVIDRSYEDLEVGHRVAVTFVHVGEDQNIALPVFVSR